jgi:hypothetical protein
MLFSISDGLFLTAYFVFHSCSAAPSALYYLVTESQKERDAGSYLKAATNLRRIITQAPVAIG